MEWKSNLRRTQSLKSIPSSCDKPTWTEAGLRGKKASVSQLVARYQTTPAVSSSIQATTRNNGEANTKPVLHEITPSPPPVSGLLETKETHLEALMKRNDERERPRPKTNLSRSKSMGSLQNSAASINALKALFESKDATQNKGKSSFRAANVESPSKAVDILPVMNGEVEGVKSSAEKQKNQIPADASVNNAKPDVKEENASRKVTRRERRKTIGGIDFEKVASSQADEKRRSFADFRDSSFNQTKEQLCVSVKAISALYLLKVAPQKPTHSLLKPEQGQSSDSGKRVKLTKMAEDSLQKKDDHLQPNSARHQQGPADIFGPHSQILMPSQPSKEMLYQQRQKCELRRLLKHTHPELKMLDEVVDEELAEVLSSESGVAAAETGYEGEVLSRRLIFENCALSNKVSPYTPKLHMAEETAERGNVSKTSAVFEVSEERPHVASVKAIVEADNGSSPDPNRECEEEVVRIDVQATRRIFESQSVNTSKPNPENKVQGKVFISGDETGAVQKRKEGFEMCSKPNLASKNISSDTTDLTEQSHNQGSCVHVVDQSTNHGFSGREEVSTGETLFEDEPTSLPDPEGFGDSIKTRAALFQNNPFISTHVEREHSCLDTTESKIPAVDSEPADNYQTANVKNRAHLFESMPFDKIRHQNKDEIETMVENIKETLDSLYHVNTIHSDGSIIEVNETMIAKKAKFSLSESGPKIKYDEVAEGGAQNFILQLLPRANLKPQITYLKEDCKGNMEATTVNVPVHQHPFTTSQDTEVKTANVVQLVEDILNQDNSLRKGVIIQEGVNRCAEVIVYSLYNYVDEKDVKSYCPPQVYYVEYDEPETERSDESKTKNQVLRTGVVESTISCLNLSNQTSQEQTCPGSMRPEVTVKGNVKLFKSCIEKGDLEYLKTLQAEPTVQEEELPQNQNVGGQGTELNPEQQGDQTEESTSEWVPVDIKRLKSMFSGDQSQPNQPQTQPKQPTAIPPAIIGQNVPLGNTHSSTERSVGVISHVQEKNYIKEGGIQAQEKACNSEVVWQLETQNEDRVHQAELVKVVDDNDEISNLKTAIHSLQQATMEAKSFHQSSQEKQKFFVQESSKEPVVSVIISDVNSVKTERKEAELHQENAQKAETASSITSEYKPVNQHENTCLKDINSVEMHTTETCSNKGQKSTEVVQKEHFETVTESSNSSETAAQQEEEEVVFEGKLQAALDSLEKSNINVTRGDFRAAMIYKKSSKARSQNVDAAPFQKTTNNEICAVTESKSIQAPLRQDVATEPPRQSETLNKPATNVASEKSKRPVCPKPAIPPKPEHLKVKQRNNQSTNTENHQTNTMKSDKTDKTLQTFTTTSLSDQVEHKQEDWSKINSAADSGPDLEDHEKPSQNHLFVEALQMSQEIQVSHQFQGSVINLEIDNTDKNVTQQKGINDTAEEKSPQNIPVNDNMNETDESPVDFNKACQKFGGKKVLSGKKAPVKPKRVKIAQPDNKNPKHSSGDNNSKILAHIEEKPQETLTGPSCSDPNTCGQTADSKGKHEREIKQEGKVEMREKKGRTETEDERRQRLSVHMDEIMKGNITAAMEIFDNLRKQEELQSILSRVEEIEEDTSEVDVTSLRKVFENVPDWVVDSNKRKQKKIKAEQKEERLPLSRDNTESKSSMAHVFGDLERASEEIMNLKEQTLARLVDIEGAIKKALYSVSTLKSDSDIVGLSCLFKESLGTVQGSPSSGNISKISIGSSRKKSVATQEGFSTQGSTALPAGQGASLEIASAKQPVSPPSSPAFISIQSAARKTDKTELLPPETTTCPTCQHSPKTEEKFRTTKTLQCNSPAQNRKNDPRKGGQKQSTYSPLKPKRELSMLEVQADCGGNSISGSTTVTENYERTDNFGNRFYSSKTSTVVNTQPETITSPTGQAVISPAPHQVTKYPEVRLPINQKP